MVRQVDPWPTTAARQAYTAALLLDDLTMCYIVEPPCMQREVCTAGAHRLAPLLTAAKTQSFAFDSPSPDDRVLAARKHRPADLVSLVSTIV